MRWDRLIHLSYPDIDIDIDDDEYISQCVTLPSPSPKPPVASLLNIFGSCSLLSNVGRWELF